MAQSLRVLVLTTSYLPGYKAGGPVRSISGMIESLGDEFEFRVVTLDRDLGDRQPYANIVPNQWTQVGKAQVMYLPPRRAQIDLLARLICETPHDVIYLGGGFDSTMVLRTLLLRWMGRIDAPAVMLAPQGVFSRGALAIKPHKKKLFLALARHFGLYGGVTWHVSTPFEKHDVRRALQLKGKPHFVVVAPDITAAAAAPPAIEHRKTAGRLQAVFLSRISPVKNLDGALRILQGVDVPIDYHIYGPLEDRAYWRVCEQEMRKLPANVSAVYHGPIPHDQVAAVMRSHDLFFLPTRGENFGHVIAEALREGCPALLANTTAFRRLEEQNAGWDLPLNDIEGFRQVLRQCAAMSHEQWQTWSDGARRLAAAMTSDEVITATYRKAFRELAARGAAARAA
ncbi:MAG: glycosyltransferase [Thermoguttaceae bacterium]